MGTNSRLAAEIAVGMAVIELTVTLAQREAEYQAECLARRLEAQKRRDAYCAQRRQS
jgi:hypothetical protein